MTTITGNTYPVKDQLKSLGGRWNPDAKGWDVPDEKADAAKQIVAAAPPPTPRKTGEKPRYTGPRKCCVCGVVEWRNSRGFTENRIYKSGECQSCFEERKMGY